MSTITVLETGTVAIRPSHRTQSARRPVLLRRARVLTDRRWTRPLPINTYLIEHADGPVLFDTGESPLASHGRHGYFPWWQPFFHVAVDIKVEPDESVGARLRQHGLTPGDLQAVVVSHLHHDHGDGLPDLVGAPVYVSAEHWNTFKHPFHATAEGMVPQHWPDGFAPRLLDPSGPAAGPFERTYPITADGTIYAIDTPGHMPGHVSLVAEVDGISYMFLGDATYDQNLLDAEQTDGVNTEPAQAIETLRKIKEFARERPTVLLPAHDPDAARRLAESEVYRPSPLR
ncbi:N-acyl homoserine lactonase family protein [Gordonia sp. VNK21]|uniref:N-acyl homoserine lactonase family protein n=1 Tax=Gordonia sp. VNK21 TaxID=3382483 RepID=UPI0038D4E36D